MGAYVAEEVVKLMVKKDVPVKKAKCLILGFTFKENCPDVRNTKVIDIVNELKTYHIEPIVYDPWANPAEVEHEYQFKPHSQLPEGKYEAIILAVAHLEFKELKYSQILVENGVLFDVKGILPKEMVDARL
jgi:UDP-N-acetyl-D-galactosamine dehydrogenase